MPPDVQHCPICGTAVRVNPRYPNQLCAAVAARATAPDGRALHFADDDTPYNGVECHAREARFRRIVIQRRV